MIYGCLLLALLSGPVSVAVALRYLTRYVAARDVRDAAERAQMAQRIQAPETAVAQHVVQHQDPPVSHLPFDDDGAWRSYQESLSGEAH